MHDVPEGTRRVRRRISRKWLLLAVIFAAYIAFRLVQATVWLVQHV